MALFYYDFLTTCFKEKVIIEECVDSTTLDLK